MPLPKISPQDMTGSKVKPATRPPSGTQLPRVLKKADTTAGPVRKPAVVTTFPNNKTISRAAQPNLIAVPREKDNCCQQSQELLEDISQSTKQKNNISSDPCCEQSSGFLEDINQTLKSMLELQESGIQAQREEDAERLRPPPGLGGFTEAVKDKGDSLLQWLVKTAIVAVGLSIKPIMEGFDAAVKMFTDVPGNIVKSIDEFLFGKKKDIQPVESKLSASSPTPTNASNLADVIGKAESGKDGYNAYNRKNKDGGYDAMAANFSKMNINQIQARQRNRTMFAVGKYQIIPDTLEDARKELGLKGDEQFTPELQDKIYNQFLLKRRKKAMDFITGKSTDIDSAVDDLSKEWAGLPTRGGKSYYDGKAGNKANVSVDAVKGALLKERQKYMSTNKRIDPPASEIGKRVGMIKADAVKSAVPQQPEKPVTNNNTTVVQGQGGQPASSPIIIPPSPEGWSVIQNAKQFRN